MSISLQQSIMMTRQRSLNSSLQEYSDAIDKWEAYTEKLEKKLRLQGILLKGETKKLKLTNQALAGTEEALAGTEEALAGTKQALQISIGATENRLNQVRYEQGRYGKLETIYKDILSKYQGAKGLSEELGLELKKERVSTLKANDSISVLRKKHGNYAQHMKGVTSGLSHQGTHDERKKVLVKVLSGFNALFSEYLDEGFEIDRMREVENEQDMHYAFVPSSYFPRSSHEERATKLSKPFNGKLDYPSAVGRHRHSMEGKKADVRDPRAPEYIPTSRGRHYIEFKSEDLKKIMWAAVAWAEYMHFVEGMGKQSLQARETDVLMQQAACLERMAELVDDATQIQTLIAEMKQLQTAQKRFAQAGQLLKEKARLFIVPRIEMLLNQCKLNGDLDTNAVREWHVCASSMVPATLSLEIDGEMISFDILSLEPAEYERIFEIYGVNEIAEVMERAYTDSKHEKNVNYTLPDGSIIKGGGKFETLDIKPPFQAHAKYAEDGTPLIVGADLEKSRVKTSQDNARHPDNDFDKIGIDLDMA